VSTARRSARQPTASRSKSPVARRLLRLWRGRASGAANQVSARDEQQRCRGAGRDGCIRRVERKTARRHRPPCRYRGTSTPVAEVGECLQAANPAAVRKRSQLIGSAPAVSTAPVGDLARRAAPSLTSDRAPARIGTTAFVLGPTRAPLLLCHASSSRVPRPRDSRRLWSRHRPTPNRVGAGPARASRRVRIARGLTANDIPHLN